MDGAFEGVPVAFGIIVVRGGGCQPDWVVVVRRGHPGPACNRHETARLVKIPSRIRGQQQGRHIRQRGWLLEEITVSNSGRGKRARQKSAGADDDAGIVIRLDQGQRTAVGGSVEQRRFRAVHGAANDAARRGVGQLQGQGRGVVKTAEKVRVESVFELGRRDLRRVERADIGGPGRGGVKYPNWAGLAGLRP